MGWETDQFIDFITDQIGGAVKASRMSWNIISDYRKIENSNLPQEIKDAALIIIVIDQIGNPLPNNIPLTIEAAYDLIYNTPDYVGGIPKEQLWAQLHALAPDEFPQDVGGWLTAADTLSNLENKPRDQVPIEGLDDNPPPPPRLADARVPYNAAPFTSSPLVLDLDGDGIELTSFNSSTTGQFFDVDGDGFAEQTAWITANQDGLLVRDINANGRIDDVAELFGSPSIDGFALLAELDNNGDHIINQYDSAWNDLRVWKDVNGDALTQTGELLSLSSLGIVSIDLAGVTASTSTISGNPISHTSTFKYSNGSTGAIVDAWFTHDNFNTYYNGDFTLDSRTLELPNLRGFGELPDLLIAMSQDEDLLDMVQEMAEDFSLASFDAASGWDQAVTDILYKWAGVESVNPTSRDGYIDARKLEFLEEFFGNDYARLQSGNPNPTEASAELIEASWTIVFESISAYLLLQSGAGALFDDLVTYSPFTGEVDGDLTLSQAAIESLEAFATDTGVNTEAYWVEVARYLGATKGFDNFSSTENGWMNDSIVATDAGLSWTEIKAVADPIEGGFTINGTGSGETINGTVYSETIYASGGNDTVYASSRNDEVHGGSGNDTLYGEAGNDTLYGDADNDILVGGAGGDTLYGGYGNDTYVFTSGNDVFTQDVNGTDTILMPNGITLSDLSFYVLKDDLLGIGSLFVVVDALGTIELEEHFNSAGNFDDWIETIAFADTSTLNLDAFSSLIAYGGQGDDEIRGGNVSRTDTFYGYAGNDYLDGGSGNDTLDGGNGNDELMGGSGNDTYVASAGFDVYQDTASGTDVIVVPNWVTVSDIHLLRLSSAPDNLQIGIDGLGQIIVKNQFSSASSVIESIQLSVSSITLTSTSIETIGTSGNDSMSGITIGASANDIFDGREGNDSMNGGNTGSDTYFFSTGQDTVNESGTTSGDRVKFHEGYAPGDISIYRSGTNGRDLFLADTNGNTLKVTNHFYNTQSQIEYVEFFDTTLWTISSMEIVTKATESDDTYYNYNIGDASTADTIYAYGGNDDMDGGEGNDLMYGGTGNDILNGGNGNDTLYGEDGTDTLNGGAGTNYIYGGAGNDTITGTGYLYGEGDNDSITGGGGADFLYGGNGNDTLNGNAGDDLLEGGAGDDTMSGGSGGGTNTVTYANAASAVTVSLAITSAQNTGGDGTDTLSSNIQNLTGSVYNDTLTGSTAANTIQGGAGDDTISGGNGNDILYGNAGTDTLTGGANADTFIFEALTALSASDTITDFSTAQVDKLDVSDILQGYDPLTDLISDFVQITDNGSSSILSVDQDGGANGFVQIATLSGVTNIAAGATATELELQAMITNGHLLAA